MFILSGVSAIRFSNDAKYLILACQNEEHSIKIFDLRDGRLAGQCRGGLKKVLNLVFSFSPVESVGGPSSLRILQGGVSHFKLLTFHPTKSILSSKTGIYGNVTYVYIHEVCMYVCIYICK